MTVPLAAAALIAALAGAPRAALAAANLATPMRVAVDATDLSRRIFRVQQTLAVTPGPLTLVLPRWLPGNHGPTGEVARLAGLVIRADSAQGAEIAWRRDPLDSHAFQRSVPAGVRQLVIGFDHLSAVTNDSGRVVMTPAMLNLQWNNVVLYPLGPAAADIPVQASLTLPAGWQLGSALRAEQTTGDTVRFAPVSLEQLVDSPVFAGRHFRRIALEPEGAARPVALNLVADSDELLQPSEAQIDAHRRLVQQADKLFGARHFQHYDFLLSLSEQLGGIGLEHHQSSENGVNLKYWQNWDKASGARALLPHEYTHSWNGKFRRPVEQLVPHFNTPLRNSLLWLYEGQTEFWGRVLAARSGLLSAELARDDLAQAAASLDSRSGRRWRDLQDTTQDALMAGRRERRDWADWQRTSAEYYIASTQLW
ncbi:MAG: peptidase M61, partial [Burkholderiales bacterium PBB5]